LEYKITTKIEKAQVGTEIIVKILTELAQQ